MFKLSSSPAWPILFSWEESKQEVERISKVVYPILHPIDCGEPAGRTMFYPRLFGLGVWPWAPVTSTKPSMVSEVMSRLMADPDFLREGVSLHRTHTEVSEEVFLSVPC